MLEDMFLRGTKKSDRQEGAPSGARNPSRNFEVVLGHEHWACTYPIRLIGKVDIHADRNGLFDEVLQRGSSACIVLVALLRSQFQRFETTEGYRQLAFQR